MIPVGLGRIADLPAGEPAPSPGDEQAAVGAVRRRFDWRGIVGPALLFVLFVAFWHYMHVDGTRRFLDRPGFLVPSPVTVINESFLNAGVRTQMLEGLLWTSIIALLGLAITIVLGIALAIAMAQAKWIERGVYPYLVTLQAIPVLAVVPVIYIVLGGGVNSRLFVCVMISIFPVVTNTLFGLLSVDAGQHDLFTLRRASRWTRLVKLQLPAAMPAVFTGFRISAGLSVVGAVVGEQFFRQGSKPGIGIVIDFYRQKGFYPQIYGGLILASALGIAVFLFFGWLNQRVVGHWHESARRSR